MTPTKLTQYKCGECEVLHDFRSQAEYCCQPMVTTVTGWACSECGLVDTDEDAARYYCLDEDIVLPATSAQLEAFGQQRLSL